MMANNDEIFYSDDDLSDSDIYQGSTFGSNYFSGNTESILGQNMWMQGSNSDLFTRENKSQVWPNSTGLSISPDNVSNAIYNTINSPINQISFGISNLLTQEKPQYKSAPVRQISYSSIAKKEPLQPVKQTNNVPKKPLISKPSFNTIDTTKKQSIASNKVTETALSAGYRFKARNPEPDPRFSSDVQLMVGPIPGHLEHDVIYNGLRGIFQAKGPVCFMFVHKSAVKDNDSGKMVKFGYVVFAERGVAQKVMKEGYITFQGHKIAIKDMLKK